MSYQIQYVSAWVVAAIAAGIGVVQVTGVANFGLPPIIGPWLSVVAAMLAVAQMALPKVLGPGTLSPTEYETAVLAKKAAQPPSSS